MIPVPRLMLGVVAVVVAASVAALGVASLDRSLHPERVVIALAIFAVCFGLTLAWRTRELPAWLSGSTAGSVLAIALLCASGIADPAHAGDLDWFVGAGGCLLVLTMVRGAVAQAWFGAGLLVAQSIVWAGPAALEIGTLTVFLWVAAAYFGKRALTRAMRDVQQFGRAEREAVEWQAAQDAHHFERQVRLTQTSRVALPMLRRIASTEGELSEADRAECRVLEQTIRDEIRGRRLLNDAVRDEVIAARRRGAFVQVLDDGGLDDLEPSLVDPVLDRVAAAIAGVRSDRIIIRTAPKGSNKAVTVVGISIDETAAALGLEDDAEDVDLWLELPRPVPAAV